MNWIKLSVVIIMTSTIILTGCMDNNHSNKNSKANLSLIIETDKYQYSLNESIILEGKLINYGTNKCKIDWHNTDLWLNFNLEVAFPNGIVAYNEPTGNLTTKNIIEFGPNEYKEFSIDLLKTPLITYEPKLIFVSMNITGKYIIKMSYHGLDFNVESNNLSIEIT